MCHIHVSRSNEFPPFHSFDIVAKIAIVGDCLFRFVIILFVDYAVNLWKGLSTNVVDEQKQQSFSPTKIFTEEKR